VRAYRRCEAVALPEANAQHERRSLKAFWDDDGMLVVSGRLPPEAGAALLRALEAHEDTSAETSAEARRADAMARVAEGALAAPDDSRDVYQVVVHVDAQSLAQPELEGRSELQDGPGIAAQSARRLACDGSRVVMQHDGEGHVLDVGRKTRVISTPLRRALRERDRGCQFPSCANTRFVDGHHVTHWAEGGETNLDNLLLLCSHCHRLVHEGGFRIERQEGAYVFFDPHGRRVLPAPPMPAVANLDLAPVEGEMPTWAGENFELDWTLEYLFSEGIASTNASELT
jgi:hypothetical protein